MKLITVYMDEIFLERFAVKRIEKITVRLKSLNIGVNSTRAGARLGKGMGRGGPFIHVAATAVGWVLAKNTGNSCFLF